MVSLPQSFSVVLKEIEILNIMSIDSLLFILFAVIQVLVALINNPEPEHSLRADLGEQFVNSKEKFMRMAEIQTMLYSEERP